jgi:hypothetical protein
VPRRGVGGRRGRTALLLQLLPPGPVAPCLTADLRGTAGERRECCFKGAWSSYCWAAECPTIVLWSVTLSAHVVCGAGVACCQHGKQVPTYPDAADLRKHGCPLCGL